MKSRLLFLLFLIYSWNYSAQISIADKKQLLKVIGEDFMLLPNQKSYPYCDYSDSFKVDMSTSILNDTVGVSFHNEHLLWHDLFSFCGKEEVLKLAKPSYVTVEEYLEFQNWVRDSIAREKLYLNEAGRTSGYLNREWTGDQANKWINYQDSYYDEKKKEYVKFDLDHRALGRILFNLNWDTPLDYNNPKLKPLLYDMYLPHPERIYEMLDFDERKIIYNYKNSFLDLTKNRIDSLFILYPFQKIIEKNKYLTQDKLVINESVATICDNYSWAQNSIFERDELSVLGHVYVKLQKKFPIIGINNPQAKAFCHWKQEMIQKEFDQKGLPYRLIITLPTNIDQRKLNVNETNFTIQKKDYSRQWRITNKEYNTFIDMIKDSILREKLYNMTNNVEEAVQLLASKNVYFDEGTMEYTEFDPSDLLLDRFLFNLNYSIKLNSFSPKTKELIDSIKNSEEYINPGYYYRFVDSKEKSIIGLFKPRYEGTVNGNDNIFWLFLTGRNKITENPIGKDYDINHPLNIFYQSTSVRSHLNLQRLIVNDTVKILPRTNSVQTNPDSLIQTITYEQAIAFYYWKYPIHNPNPKDDWQKFVLPSKEQFEAVQSGKQVIVPEKKVAYPTPLFRYVVHVYPK